MRALGSFSAAGSGQACQRKGLARGFGSQLMKNLSRNSPSETLGRSFKPRQSHIEEFIENYYNRQRLHSPLGYRPPEEFEPQAQDADSMTQLCSPSLEFFLGGEEKTSTRMLEQGTQTAVPLFIEVF
jgi:hypothetical protein